MASLQPVREQTVALREALQNVLIAVDAMPVATSCERIAHDDQRRRVLQLLSELSSNPPVNEHTSIVSPSLDYDTSVEASGLSGGTHEREAGYADSVDFYPLPQHRLLGNLFSRPTPPHQSTRLENDGANDENNPKTTLTHCLEEKLWTQHTTPSNANYADSTRDSLIQRGAHVHGEEKSESHPRLRSNEELAPANNASRTSSDEQNDDICSKDTDDSQHERCLACRGDQLAFTRASSPSPRRYTRICGYTNVTPSFWINVWPCYGNAICRTSRPARVLVRGCFRFFQDVVERAAAQTHCQPACPFLYTPDGRPVRELEILAPEQHYLLFPSGGFYRKRAVPTALLWQLYRDARYVVQCL